MMEISRLLAENASLQRLLENLKQLDGEELDRCALGVQAVLGCWLLQRFWSAAPTCGGLRSKSRLPLLPAGAARRRLWQLVLQKEQDLVALEKRLAASDCALATAQQELAAKAAALSTAEQQAAARGAELTTAKRQLAAKDKVLSALKLKLTALEDKGSRQPAGYTASGAGGPRPPAEQSTGGAAAPQQQAQQVAGGAAAPAGTQQQTGQAAGGGAAAATATGPRPAASTDSLAPGKVSKPATVSRGRDHARLCRGNSVVCNAVPCLQAHAIACRTQAIRS
jgi:hypothetical protein